MKRWIDRLIDEKRDTDRQTYGNHLQEKKIEVY